MLDLIDRVRSASGVKAGDSLYFGAREAEILKLPIREAREFANRLTVT